MVAEAAQCPTSRLSQSQPPSSTSQPLPAKSELNTSNEESKESGEPTPRDKPPAFQNPSSQKQLHIHLNQQVIHMHSEIHAIGQFLRLTKIKFSIIFGWKVYKTYS